MGGVARLSPPQQQLPRGAGVGGAGGPGGAHEMSKQALGSQPPPGGLYLAQGPASLGQGPPQQAQQQHPATMVSAGLPSAAVGECPRHPGRSCSSSVLASEVRLRFSRLIGREPSYVRAR